MRSEPKQAEIEHEISGLFADKFQARDLLDALNGTRDFAREQRDFAKAIGSIRPDARFEYAGEIFVTELRTLVDAWLESGHGADGLETPRERKMALMSQETALGKAGWTAFDLLRKMLFQSPPRVLLTESGEVKMALRTPPTRWEPHSEALRESRILFLLLMASEVKYALFKCSHPGCGIYYVLEKPRGVYKSGTVCPDHRGQTGKRMRRKREHAQALQAAAEALAMWPKLSPSTRSKFKSEKHYAASKLQRFGWGSKFVSRNLAQIEKREVSNDA